MEPRLYLAFPDGVFHYVCAECTALCCRGHGFGGSLKREMTTLFQLYPALESTTARRRGDIIRLANPAEGCFFLQSDHRCGIEERHGKALKPGICTLFPFNRFTRIGDAVAVSPHFLCPLRLQVPARPGEVEGTHSVIEAAVRESALLDPDYLATDGGKALPPSVDVEALLAREESFRDTCSLALGRRRFAETLRGAAVDPARWEALLSRAAPLLGLTPSCRPDSRDSVDDLLLALAPTYRLYLLDLPPDGILLALALLELLLRRVMSLSDQPPTPSGAIRILSPITPAVRLVARGECPLELPADTGSEFPRLGSPAMSLAGYLALAEGAGPASTLEVLELALKEIPSTADRTALLIDLGIQAERMRAGQTQEEPR